MQQAAGVTSVVAVLALAATAVISGAFRGQTPAQSIACRRVLELAPQYVARQLDSELIAQIDEHLGRCKRCREEIHARFPQLPPRAADNGNDLPCPTAGTMPGRWIAVLAVYQSDR